MKLWCCLWRETGGWVGKNNDGMRIWTPPLLGGGAKVRVPRKRQAFQIWPGQPHFLNPPLFSTAPQALLSPDASPIPLDTPLSSEGSSFFLCPLKVGAPSSFVLCFSMNFHKQNPDCTLS